MDEILEFLLKNKYKVSEKVYLGLLNNISLIVVTYIFFIKQTLNKFEYVHY